MHKPSTADQLQANLSGILDNTRLMLGLLEAERKALTDNDIKALDAAAAAKLGLAETLERLDQQRTELVCRHQAEHQRPQTMAALLDALDANGNLSSLWSAVQNSVIDCDRLNQVNGTALRVRRDSVSRALGLLQGSAATSSPLYDQAGNTEADRLAGQGTSLGCV